LSLTFPAAHTAKTKLGSVHEDWLFQFYYDAEGANDWIGLSGTDRIVSSNQYYGLIEDYGELSHAINIVESKAVTGSLSLRCINKWKTGTLSELLYGGSEKFLNRQVKLYSCLNDESTLSNCAFLEALRLVSISHDEQFVYLELEKETPWDYISIPTPSSRSDYPKNIYFPVAYGAYTGALWVEDDYFYNKKLFPIPVNEFRAETVYALSLYDQTTSGGGASSPNPHYYDSMIDRFLPLYGISNTGDIASESYQSGNATITWYKLNRTVKYKPIEISALDSFTDGTNAFDNPTAATSLLAEALDDSETGVDVDDGSEFVTGDFIRVDSEVMEITSVSSNTLTVVRGSRDSTAAAHNDNTQVYFDGLIEIDDDSLTSATITHSDTGAATPTVEETNTLELKMPQIEGKISYIKVTVRGRVEYSITVNAGSGTQTLTYRITNTSLGTDDDLISGSQVADGSGDTGYTEGSSSDFYAEYESNSGIDIVKIEVGTRITGDVATDVDYSAKYYITDVRVQAKTELDMQEDDDRSNLQGAINALSNLDMLYSGGDGYDEDFTDGSGSTASLPHEIHRDLLDRFAGVDYDNEKIRGYTSGGDNPQYLSDDLDSARSGWEMRLWQLEPRALKEILEQIQFEGCFIFFLSHDADGSGNAGGKYVWVHDTYASGDVSYTLDEMDYKDLNISMTDIKDIKTKTTYNFQKHPAGNGYIQTETYTNSTARTNWNFGTLENYEEINLDYLNNCGDNNSDSVPVFHLLIHLKLSEPVTALDSTILIA